MASLSWQTPGARRYSSRVGVPCGVPPKTVSRSDSVPFGLSPKDSRNSGQCQASNQTKPERLRYGASAVMRDRLTVFVGKDSIDGTYLSQLGW